jgi:hypothetical protein
VKENEERYERRQTKAKAIYERLEAGEDVEDDPEGCVGIINKRMMNMNGYYERKPGVKG